MHTRRPQLQLKHFQQKPRPTPLRALWASEHYLAETAGVSGHARTEKEPAHQRVRPLSPPFPPKIGNTGLISITVVPTRVHGCCGHGGAAMGSGTWRKAYGALNDSTKVGLANLNSEYKDLDIAIVKATNHEKCPSKERHLRRILYATSANRPRADVAYSICTLARRLYKTKNWIVALKTLIVIHRLLREGDGAFKDDFWTYSYRGNILQIPQFKDDSSPLAWDCSAWVVMIAMLQCSQTYSRHTVEQEPFHAQIHWKICSEMEMEMCALLKLFRDVQRWRWRCNCRFVQSS